jgi:hypothetical protein
MSTVDERGTANWRSSPSVGLRTSRVMLSSALWSAAAQLPIVEGKDEVASVKKKRRDDKTLAILWTEKLFAVGG